MARSSEESQKAILGLSISYVVIMNIEVPDVVINHHGNVKALIRFASSDIWFTAFKGVRDLTKMQSAASLDKVLDLLRLKIEEAEEKL